MSDMDIVNCSPLQWSENESYCVQALQDNNVYNQIPILNVNDLHNLKDSTLVRFRGMIQDMHGPEFYLEKFEVKNEENGQSYMKNGKYQDLAGCQPNETLNVDGPSTVRAERQTFVAISIPGLNSWVSKIEEEKLKLPHSVQPSSSVSQTKRALEEEDMDVDAGSESTSAVRKRHCTADARAESSVAIPPEYLLNFPIFDSKGKVCHLKVYNNSELLKLNAVCEFVGFLSVNVAMTCQNNDEAIDEAEFQVHNPSPLLIPRIHVVAFNHLPHNNPLLINGKLPATRMSFLRKELLILLTQLLLGDELAAEYTILHLISSVYLRKDFLALGKFSLNISNVPAMEGIDYVQELYKFLELLVTKSHYLAMTLENMNDLVFTPKKDYTTNRLTSSILQLSDNTHLILDETKLTAGKLNQGGVDAVRALSNAIKYQKNMYDFTYYQVEFDCDIPFLILSEGKSMLPSDIHVVLEVDDMHVKTFNEILEAARHFLNPDLLNDLRMYLTSARLVEYELSDDIQEVVQNDFVKMRQNGNVSGDDLHKLLVLARLVCIAEGRCTLDSECWKKACTLKEKLKERTKKISASNV